MTFSSLEKPFVFVFFEIPPGLMNWFKIQVHKQLLSLDLSSAILTLLC